ncbi:MAG: hypothetical protein LBJ08_07180, partial [Bifidobacteriaceae bacterium]|nr:hypothetical protein [Bifidobacteriaceae bacterium]
DYQKRPGVTDATGTATFTLLDGGLGGEAIVKFTGMDVSALPPAQRLTSGQFIASDGSTADLRRWQTYVRQGVDETATLRLSDSMALAQRASLEVPGGQPGTAVSIGLNAYFPEHHLDWDIYLLGGFRAPYSDQALRDMRQWTTLDAASRATFSVLPGKSYQVFYAGDPNHPAQNLPFASPPDAADASVRLDPLAGPVTVSGRIAVQGGKPTGAMVSLVAACDYEMRLNVDEHAITDDVECTPMRTVNVRANGRFTIGGLSPNAPKAYTLFATVPGYKQTAAGNWVANTMWHQEPDFDRLISTGTDRVTAQTIRVKQRSGSIEGTFASMGGGTVSVQGIGPLHGSDLPLLRAAIVGKRYLFTGVRPGLIPVAATGKSRCANAEVQVTKNKVTTAQLKGSPCAKARDVGTVKAAIVGDFAVGHTLKADIRGTTGKAKGLAVSRSVMWLDEGRLLHRGTTLTLTASLAGKHPAAVIVSRAKGAAPRYDWAVYSGTEVAARLKPLPTKLKIRVFQDFEPTTLLYAITTTYDAECFEWRVTGAQNLSADYCSYAWYRDGKKIRGASGSTYTMVRSDAGHGIRAEVTVSIPGYRPAVRSGTFKASKTWPPPDPDGI